MAVAGFSQDELSMTQEQNMLVVSGQKSGEDTGEYLHRGIGRTSAVSNWLTTKVTGVG